MLCNCFVIFCFTRLCSYPDLGALLPFVGMYFRSPASTSTFAYDISRCINRNRTENTFFISVRVDLCRILTSTTVNAEKALNFRP